MTWGPQNHVSHVLKYDNFIRANDDGTGMTMTMITVMTTISDHHGQPLPIQSTSDRSLPRAQHMSLDQSNLHDYH